MAADLSAVPGPPCDLCAEYAAVMSLMNYADYGQMKMCSNCAPHFMRTVADSIDGRQTADPETPAEPDPLSNSGSEVDAPDSTSAVSGSDDDEPGSAKDHWASTTHVRRSTHGHRRPAGATGKPREGDPE